MRLATLRVLSLLALLGCDTDKAAEPACVPGKVESCPCAGGAEGAQTCGGDGRFAPCQCVGLTCPAGLDACGEGCFDLDEARAHCGGCGNTCASGLACVDGACVLTCPQGQLLCEGQCISPSSDERFCGAVGPCQGGSRGAACGPAERCSDGVCTTSCPTGQVLCQAQCVDPLTDRRFCGAAGTCSNGQAGRSCPAGEVCSNGSCEPSCQAGLVLCDGLCIDPRSNRTFCGARDDCLGAGRGVECRTGEVCSGGACAVSCQPGLVLCGDLCVNPQNDRRFCGAAGSCRGSEAGDECAPGEVCSAGRCALSCQSRLLDCGGTCIDPLTDRTFCGASGMCTGTSTGTACRPGEVCAMGSCEVSCPLGLLRCADTCVDPERDDRFCGASGDCGPGRGGVVCARNERCELGSCRLVCPTGTIECGGTCVDPQTDENFCGSGAGCRGGTSCAAGESCIAGTCTEPPLTWRQPTLPSSAPLARANAAFEWDPVSNVGLLFGGRRAGYGLLDDLWMWTGTSWVLLNGGGNGPSPRAGAGAAYDAHRQRLVIFGSDASGNDTWEWDGTSWRRVSTTRSPPSTTRYPAMVYDTQSRRVILYIAGFNQTWSYDGSNWTQFMNTGTGPNTTQEFNFAWDSAQNRALTAFGGNVWAFSGGAWQQVAVSGVRPGATWSSVAFDTRRSLLLSFGGGSGVQLLNEAWVFGGTAWFRPPNSGSAPSPRGGVAITYDPSRDTFILFGGEDSSMMLGDTWLLSR